MKKLVIVVVSFLVGLILLSCGGGNGSMSSSVIFTANSGSVSPAYVYHETVTISDNVMEINRTGGSNIIVGDWKVTITNAEASQVNKLLALIDPVSDADIVSDTGPVGGGSMQIQINDNVTFTNGYVYDEATSSSKYHKFSPDVANLADYINTLLKKYGYYNKVIGP